jgi:transcriptional regulator with XRE-family HTH domain
MNSLGERLKYLRKTNKITQQQLANATGIKRGNISHYENNDFKPSSAASNSIAKFFKVSVNWLINGEGNMPKIIDEKSISKNENKVSACPQKCTSEKQFGIKRKLDNPWSDFGNRLIFTIQYYKTDIESVCKELNISVKALNNYINGRVPPVSVLYKLSNYFYTSIDWLLTGKELSPVSTDLEKEYRESNKDDIMCFNDFAIRSYISSPKEEYTKEEQNLIESFRQLDSPQQEMIIASLNAGLKSSKNKKGLSSTYKNGEEAADKEMKELA